MLIIIRPSDADISVIGRNIHIRDRNWLIIGDNGEEEAERIALGKQYSLCFSLLSSYISGGTLSQDGRTAIIYNGETFTDPEKAKKAAVDFQGKINKFKDDNQGDIGGSKATPVVFREFHRGGGKVAQNDYDWIASNLHPSETYKKRLGQLYSESKWARGQFKRIT